MVESEFANSHVAASPYPELWQDLNVGRPGQRQTTDMTDEDGDLVEPGEI